jgi:hypothetical protein
MMDEAPEEAQPQLPDKPWTEHDGEHFYLNVPVSGVLRIGVYGSHEAAFTDGGEAAWAEVLRHAASIGTIPIFANYVLSCDDPSRTEGQKSLAGFLPSLQKLGSYDVVLVTPDCFKMFFPGGFPAP